MTGHPDVLDEEIASAWDELLLARVDHDYSPNADTTRTKDYAELRLNRLLERLFGAMSEQQRQAVDARPVRMTVDAG